MAILKGMQVRTATMKVRVMIVLIKTVVFVV
jgi:hypothetical protein